MSDGYNVDPLSALNSANETEGDELILNSGSGTSPRLVKKGERWTLVLFMAAAASTLGSCVPAGYNIGVVNAPAQVIKQFCNETILNTYGTALTPIVLETLWSSIVSIFVIGGVIGSITGSASANKWGRKVSIIITDMLGLAAALFFIVSKEASSVESLLIGRFIIGLSSGLSTVVVPMYLTELAPLRLRGATGVMCPLGLTVGVLLGQAMGLESLLGRENTWHYLLALYSLPILLTVIFMFRLPESPKYLAAIRRKEEHAIKELLKIRSCGEEHISEEIEQLRKEVTAGIQRTTWNSCKVLKDPELRLPLVLVCALQAGQQFSGINAVFYYSITIFESAGLNTTESTYANMAAGAVNLLAAIISVYTMNHFGRRPLVLISCIGCILCLCLLVLSIALFTLASWLSYISVAAVLFYVLIYGLGLGPIPYFIGTELFEVGPRPIGMGWGSTFNWGANFTVGMLFPFLQSVIGEFSFLIFIAIVIALTVLLILYFPETKDRDQAEISAIVKYGFKSKIRRKPMENTNLKEKRISLLAQTEFDSI